MVDIHCHILPGIDDGAQDMAESVQMARMAYDSGVTDIAVTPHFRGERESLDLIPVIEEGVLKLRKALFEEGIDINIHQGAEILCVAETPYLAEAGLLPTIGDSKYVLLEFYFDESLFFMNECLGAISNAGYTPIVAHPERYDAVQRDSRTLIRWFREGYILQLNKGSILGSLGRGAELVADFMLDNGLAHLIASDAHSSERRTPDMNGLRRYLSENIDGGYTRIILRDNPRRILKGKDVVPAS